MAAALDGPSPVRLWHVRGRTAGRAHLTNAPQIVDDIGHSWARRLFLRLAAEAL